MAPAGAAASMAFGPGQPISPTKASCFCPCGYAGLKHYAETQRFASFSRLPMPMEPDQIHLLRSENNVSPPTPLLVYPQEYCINPFIRNYVTHIECRSSYCLLFFRNLEICLG